jgi:hypothetical protein
MAMVDDLEEVIEQYHLALGEFVKGNPEHVKQLYPHQEDVTLANPLGPPARGWEQVAETIDRAASNLRDGENEGFEIVAKYVTPELAYIVEIERPIGSAGYDDLSP